MCLGIAEIDKETIPQELSNVPVKTLDDFRADLGSWPLLVIVKREILRETYGHPRQEVVR